MRLKYFHLLFLSFITYSLCAQFPVSLSYNKNKLINWKTKKNIKINKNYFPADSSILIKGVKDFCMGHNNYFTPSKEMIYTFEFQLLIDSNTIVKRIGEIGIGYEYKNEYGNISNISLFRSDILMTDTLKSKKWYKFSKSIYLSDLKNIKFSFYYKNLNKMSSNFYVRNLKLKSKKINDFFENNLVLNGGFEVNSIEPSWYFEMFNFVPFWENNIIFDTLLTRDTPYHYIKILKKDKRGLSQGTPDLISNFIYHSKENENLKFGKYCAKLLLPNFRTSKNKGGEYLQNKLKEELKKDTLYELSVYLKLSQYSGYTVNNFGALFSEYAYDTYDSIFYKNYLHKSNLFFTKEYLKISKDWIGFKVIYKAKGKEKYLLIGCFENRDGLNTDKKYHNTKSKIGKSPIVYIDNITLVKTNSE